MTDEMETFLPVPDLPTDDIYGVKGREGGGYMAYKTVTVIKHSGPTVFLNHNDGSSWAIRKESFINVPTSVALQMAATEGIDIISNENAKKFIQMAVEKNNEVNKEIMKYNQTVRQGETKWIPELKRRVTFRKKKPVLVQNNRPYDHYIRAKEEWKRKKMKKASKPKRKSRKSNKGSKGTKSTKKESKETKTSAVRKLFNKE